MFHKHATAAKSNSPAYQIKNYVLAFWADPRYVFHLDDEFAAAKVCARLLTRIPQFGGPGLNELSFHNQSPLLGAINQRDLQHCIFPLMAKATRTPNLRSRKLLNFQEGNNRTRNIEVEGVERVETVEATGKS
jgi:hypothetical protein